MCYAKGTNVNTNTQKRHKCGEINFIGHDTIHVH